MINPRSSLRRKDEDVVAKVMDGEAIIINLATGVYYSMSDVAGAAWELIEAGYPIAEIVGAVVARYDVDEEQAREDVLRLAQDLMREELVVAADEDRALQPLTSPAASTKLAYVVPQLNTYTDMEDLLALDPPTPSFNDIPWKG
jgi:hypothetical protein